MNEPIIDPIDKNLLLSELTEDKLLRHTNKANNLIYMVDAHNSPNVMREIGRLREYTFRAVNGGTGKSCDIDEYDTMEKPCRQLIVWNPDANEIIGGYRFIKGSDMALDENCQPMIQTSHIFHFQDKPLKKYLPNMIELGRAFVVPDYQSSKQGAKSLYALDNLWDGIGALTIECPEIKYMFGKVTVYPAVDKQGRDLILYFLQKYCKGVDGLMAPYRPVNISTPLSTLDAAFEGLEYAEAYKQLHAELQKINMKIPPLVNAYISLSPTLKYYGTAVNDAYGIIEDSAIVITLTDVYESKRERHIESYLRELEKSNRKIKFEMR